jgi:hypothetical protein
MMTKHENWWDVKENIIKNIDDRIFRLSLVPNHPEHLGKATYLKKVAIEKFGLHEKVAELIEAEKVYYEQVDAKFPQADS